jgi:hypothetical protein
MNARARSQAGNAILVGVALALVVLVLGTRTAATTAEQEYRFQNLLRAFREDDITRVRFERKEDPFTLKRTGVRDDGAASWQLTEPVKEDAESFGVRKVLDILDLAAEVRRIKPEEVDRKAFGLDDPSLVVHVDMGDIKYRLRLGGEAASPEGSRYMEIAGESAPGLGVAIVSRSTVAEFQLSASELRERYVMPYLSVVLDRITLTGEGGERKLRRGTWTDGFRFDGMLGDARVNRAALNRVLLQFARTKAARFIDAGVAEKAVMAGPRVEVTMIPTKASQPRGAVTVGGTCPGNDTEVVALRTAPDRLAACVPKSVLSGLTTPVDALVDRTLFWMRIDEVEAFGVSRGEEKLEVVRKEAGFVLRAPREGELEGDAGNMRLEALLRATGTITPSPDRAKLGLSPAAGRAVVKSAAADDSRVVEEAINLGTVQPDGKVYVERVDDGVVLELERDAARAVSPDASLLKSRSLLDIGLIDVTGVEVDGAIKQVISRSSTAGFTYVTPSGFTADASLALDLFDTLRTLSAERWVSERDDGSFGFERSPLTARLRSSNASGTLEHVLHVGNPAGSGYYAKLDSTPGVFVLSRRNYETLTTLAFDRGVFLMDPQSTARVTLQAADRKIVLDKLGDEFVEANPGETPRSPEAIRRIVDALTTLRAEAALEVGAPRPEFGMDRPVLTVTIDPEPGHEERPRRVTWRAGAGDSWRGMSVHYARVDGVSATYAVARSGIRAILDAI